MANVQVMVPAELAQETSRIEAGDELLTADELESISLFETLKKAPNFSKFPGTTVLRRGNPGRVICTQGQPGSTAFYILTSEDALEIRQQQLKNVRERCQVLEKGDELAETPSHQFLTQFDQQQLSQREQELLLEIEELQNRIQEMHSSSPAAGQPARRVASARLLVQFEDQQKKPGWLKRMLGTFRKSTNDAASIVPKSVPIDGPTDIDTGTMQAPMHEGDIFGEMSCMNRAPRSATVTVEQDCYMLEMLRNVLDMLQRDPGFRQKMDDLYRQRVMESNVRRMELFQDLTDTEYEQLSQAIELQVFDAGKIIVEEGDPSDSIYVVRSGLVKVVHSIGCRLRIDDFSSTHWTELLSELKAAEGMDESTPHNMVWKSISPDLQTAISNASQTPNDELKGQLLEGCNRFIKEGTLHLARQYGKSSSGIMRAIDDAQLRLTLEAYPDKTDHWSELESRIFHRLLLEHVYPKGIPRRIVTDKPMQTLSYLGRGEILGEMGVLRNIPRSATCIAYDHPEGFHQRIPDSRTGAVPSRVELVRIPADSFRSLLDSSPISRYRVQELTREREKHSEDRKKDLSTKPHMQSALSAEFEDLGLIQGQQLMLINLDRCTRCNGCVEACVTAHSDGQTRLFLDGPRFEKYLVPLTCRSCLDPVCMIGCPVGAINRGDGGEIVIRNWCIGCELCADQCPYGSIQMNELQNVELSTAQLNVLDPETTVKPVTERAVVCDLCQSLPSQDPACVYACPHDAAIRVDARDFFIETGHQ